MRANVNIPEYYTKHYGKGRGYSHIFKTLIQFAKEPILDLGCGTGGWVDFLLKNNIKDITPVDWFCDNLKDYPKFLKFDLNKYPYPLKSKYKTISIFSTIFLLDSPFKTLKEIHRLLDERGILLVNFGSSFWFYQKVYKCKVPYVISRRSAKHLLEVSGFEVVKVYRNPYLGFIPFINLRHNWFVCKKKK